MPTKNGDDQSQAGGQGSTPPDGGSPQPGQGSDGSTGSGTDGAKPVTQPEPRTYSEAEVRAIQAAGDTRASNAEQIAAKATMQMYQERATAAETTAKAADVQHVEDGTLSQEQATVRTQERTQRAEEAVAWESEKASHDKLRADSNILLKTQYAVELAKEYEVDMATLESDPEITTHNEMVIKAQALKIENLTNGAANTDPPENFDGGGFSGGATADLDNKDPLGMSVLAYGDAETQKRKKIRG